MDNDKIVIGLQLHAHSGRNCDVETTEKTTLFVPITVN